MKNIAFFLAFCIAQVLSGNTHPNFLNNIYGKWRITATTDTVNMAKFLKPGFELVFTEEGVVIYVSPINIDEEIQPIKRYQFSEATSEIIIRDTYTIDRFRVTSMSTNRVELETEDGEVLVMERS